MLRILLTILFSIAYLNFSYSQTLAGKIKQNVNGFELSLNFNKEPYILEGEKNNIINYYETFDESKPSEPALPSKTIYVAIPPGSKVRVSFLNVKFNYINNVFAKVNPEIAPSQLFDGLMRAINL